MSGAIRAFGGPRCLVRVCALFSTLAGFAQDVAILQRGDVHLLAAGGFNFRGGVTLVPTDVRLGSVPEKLLTLPTNGSVGIQAEYNLTRLVAIQGEFSYLAGGTLLFNP